MAGMIIKKRVSRIWILGAYLSLILILIQIPLIAQSGTHLDISVGETMVFELKVLGYEVGIQVMRLVDQKPLNGKSCYRAMAETISSPDLKQLALKVAGKPYELRDVFMTYMTQDDFQPLRVLKRIHEGGWEDNVRIDFDTNKGEGVYTNKRNLDGKDFSWNGSCMDVLSMVFHLRNKPLKAGDQYAFQYLDEKTFKATRTVVQVDQPTTIQSGGQSLEVVCVRQIGGDVVRGIEIYITNDRRRIPIKISIGAFNIANYGTINVVGTLVEYDRKGEKWQSIKEKYGDYFPTATQ